MRALCLLFRAERPNTDCHRDVLRPSAPATGTLGRRVRGALRHQPRASQSDELWRLKAATAAAVAGASTANFQFRCDAGGVTPRRANLQMQTGSGRSGMSPATPRIMAGLTSCRGAWPLSPQHGHKNVAGLGSGRPRRPNPAHAGHFLGQSMRCWSRDQRKSTSIAPDGFSVGKAARVHPPPPFPGLWSRRNLPPGPKPKSS